MTKVIGLQARNFKRLKAVHIRPKGNTVVVGGRNAQGKSSVLDAIWAALGGGRAAPDQPIHHGQSKSEIELDLGELKVIRRFTGKGSQLEIRNRAGTKVKSPQAVLDAMVGSLSFDPLEFCRMKPKDQAEQLRELVGLDTDEVDAEIEQWTQERAQANREVKRLQGVADSATRHDDAPDTLIVFAELMEQLEDAREYNAERARLLDAAGVEKTDALKCEQAASNIAREVATLEAQREQLLADASDHLDAAAAHQTTVEGMGLRDLSGPQEQLSNAEATNAKVRDNIAANNAEQDLAEAKSAVEQTSERLTAARTRRHELIKSASFPVEGLAVTEDGVTYQGVALEQASGAEKIRVSAAIGLAMNPELRVLLIRDGSLLDDESLDELAKLAVKSDAQVWIERVGKGDEVTVVIEDGEVIEDDNPAEEEAATEGES